ncbi:hypothetical protein FF1_031199 [Malus domestica]
MALEKKDVGKPDKDQFKEGESADEEQKKLKEEAAKKNEFMALEKKDTRRLDKEQFKERETRTKRSLRRRQQRRVSSRQWKRKP